MTAEQRQSALTDALATLQQNPEALPWPDRRQLPGRLGQALKAGNGQDGLLPLINLLAEDPKPEVRPKTPSRRSARALPTCCRPWPTMPSRRWPHA